MKAACREGAWSVPGRFKVQLSVRDAARIFGVAEKTVYKWIREKDLPARFVQKCYRFNQSELLNWAALKGVKIADQSLWSHSSSHDKVSLARALEAGGIFYGVEARDKNEALNAILGRMLLPKGVDREILAKFVLAREAMASTGIGDGIAIPHPRNPIVLHVPYPVVTLCFLRQAVEYQSIDGIKVDKLFAVVVPNVRIHLQMLACLSWALRDPDFMSALFHRKPAPEILAAAKKLDHPESGSR